MIYSKNDKAIYIAYEELVIFDNHRDARILEKYDCKLGRNGATIKGENLEELFNTIAEVNDDEVQDPVKLAYLDGVEEEI